MKRSSIQIPWKEGLHLRPAAALIGIARQFQSRISLKVRDRVSDARSILGILLLCASFGTQLEVEITGADEDLALTAIESLFETNPAELEGLAEDKNSSDRPTA